jgi:hypothetical protein
MGVSLVFTLGCGGVAGDALTADASLDATADASDGAADVSAIETGAPDAGADAVIGMSFKCGDTNVVTDCAQCTGATQPCVYCNATTATQMVGICTVLHSNCIGAIPAGYQDCPCGGNVSKCPEAYQICNQTGSCHTCSDATGNNNLACNGGGTCNATTGSCM